MIAQFVVGYGPLQWLYLFMAVVAVAAIVALFIRTFNVQISPEIMKLFYLACGVVGIVVAFLICLWGIRMVMGGV